MTENDIREILLRRWDPIRIRGNPHLFDEYDDYIPEIQQLLETISASREELKSLLVNIEKEIIGTNPNLESINKSVSELMSLR